MKSFLSLSAALFCVLAFAADVSACETYDSVFTTNWRNDANADLNDYSRILMDAENPNCARTAMYYLTTKVKNELDSSIPGKPHKQTFQRWLDGYKVAAIFAAAHRLGANGWANKDLDDQLARLEGRFAHFVEERNFVQPELDDPHPSGMCGGDALNTCMDDLIGTASGYAWMAAYQKYRPHRVFDGGLAKRQQAEQFLRDALTPVQSTSDNWVHGICFRMKPLVEEYGSPLCDANLSDFLAGNAETLSVNGNQQMIHYGFGLLTSVAITKMGLEVAGSTFQFDSNQRRIMKGLFEEAQRNITSGSYNSNCFSRNPLPPNGDGQLVRNKNCGNGYFPDLFALKPWYDQYVTPYVGFPTAGTYTSNSINYGRYDLDEPNNPLDPNPFFSYQRYVGYVTMSYNWVNSRPEMMPSDNFNPDGYFEAINSTTGLAQGWACDKDVPTKAAKVDFYADGVKVTEVELTPANSDSVQQEINNICGGGTAHRFWVYLPNWTRGKQITAYGLDYTWYGFTNIGTRTW